MKIVLDTNGVVLQLFQCLFCWFLAFPLLVRIVVAQDMWVLEKTKLRLTLPSLVELWLGLSLTITTMVATTPAWVNGIARTLLRPILEKKRRHTFFYYHLWILHCSLILKAWHFSSSLFSLFTTWDHYVFWLILCQKHSSQNHFGAKTVPVKTKLWVKLIWTTIFWGLPVK